MTGLQDASTSRVLTFNDGCRAKPTEHLHFKGGRAPSPTYCFQGGQSGAGLIYLDPWIIQSISDGNRVPCVLNELRSLRVDVVALFEAKGPGSGEISKRRVHLA